MVAGLLYIIGLIAVVITIVMAGLQGPSLYQALMTNLQAPSPNYLNAISELGRGLAWALSPFVAGLLLMAVGRIITLLSAINRALRGTP